MALIRGGLYNFLAVSFAEPPSPGFTELLYRSRAPALLADKGLGGDDLRRLAEDAGGEAPETLSSAYTRLLVRRGPDAAPPLASEYLDVDPSPQDPLSLGPVAESVAAAYRQAGVVVSGAGLYPPQHLAIELQFMHHCAAREAAAWGENSGSEAALWRQRQRDFLAAHLLPWVPDFCQRVDTRETHPWLRALAALTVSFLASDADHLAADLPEASPSAAQAPGTRRPPPKTIVRPPLRAGGPGGRSQGGAALP